MTQTRTPAGTVICTNCQKEVPADANVCGYCGHRLKENMQEKIVAEDREVSQGTPTDVLATSEVKRPTIAPLAVVAGVALAIAPSTPWFGLAATDGWDTFMFPEIANDFDLPNSLLSYGTAVFAVGVTALLIALYGGGAITRRILGLLAIGLVAFAVATVGEGNMDWALSWIEVGPWIVLASGFVLLTGR